MYRLNTECASEIRSLVSCAPSVSERESAALAQYMKYVALLEVQNYDGENREYTFQKFLDMFALKYPSRHCTDEERGAILVHKVVGKARRVLEALPMNKK